MIFLCRPLAFVFMLGFVVSCGAPSQAQRLTGNWILEKVRNQRSGELTLEAKDAPFLIFDNGTVTEVDGAARLKYRLKLLPTGFRGTYTVEDGQIKVAHMNAHITELTEDRLVYIYGYEYIFKRVAQTVVESEMRTRFGSSKPAP